MNLKSLALKSSVGVMALTIASIATAQDSAPPADTGAQPAAATAEEIVVTGSRIRRDPLSQDAPIVFVDQGDIAKTGLTSINDVLQRLPSSGGGLNGKFNNSGNLGNPPDGGGVGAGAAEIDLRYLGSRRVLVLVDGIRFVNGASASGVPGSTDLNAIPESAIERVEVLQDGASSIYGSDAIAGVVNIITKRSQKGLQAVAQVGQYGEGDGLSQSYQLSWGNGNESPLKVVVGANFVKQDSVSAGDRAISAFPAPYSNSCADGGCSGFLPNGRYAIFGQDLTLIAPVLGSTATPADFRDFVSPDDRFNFAPYNFIQIPIKRYGVFGNLSYEVGPDINFSVKGIWNKRKSKNQAAPLPFGVGVAAGITPVLDNTTVDATNIYNPFGVTLDSSNMDFIFRRFVEGGPRQFFQTVTTTYGVATLDGKFDIGDRNWFWDVNLAYGRNKAKQTMLGNINSDNLRRALGPDAACVAPCVPFNLFGGAGSITQAMMDYVTFEQNDSSRQTTFDLTGNLSGTLFELPGGPVGLAIGLEYRDQDGRFDPDPVVAAGFSSDIPAQPTKGGYKVKEAYAELNVPFIKDIAFAEILELNGAVRRSHYETNTGQSFSKTTFKGGLNWKPYSDLRLRASWAQGFRAPSIGELFGTQSRFDQTLSDPCSNDSTAAQNYTNNTTVRNNCISAGVPNDGSYQQANPQISVIVGGNDALRPETSESWVLGAVWSPGFARGLSAEVNWYTIKIDGAIQTVDAEVTVNNCMVNNDPAACALLTRVNGNLTQVSGFLVNIAGVKTKGVDFNLAYRTPKSSVGQFKFNWNNSFLLNYDVIVPITGGTQVISREGTEQGSPTQGYPDWKSVGTIDWEGSNFGATLTGRYVSSLKEGDGNRLDSRFYTDLQLRWTPSLWEERFGLAFGVNNLFKTKAPGCFTCDINNFDPTVYDVPGRFFYGRVSFKM